MVCLKDGLCLKDGPCSSASLGSASISITDLAGSLRAELEFDVGSSIGQLKQAIRPIATPNATETAEIILFFDGSEPNDAVALNTIGIIADEPAYFTMIVHDIQAMAIAEINEMHKEAIERSRHEACAARKVRQEQIRQRIEQQEAAYAADREQQEGPLLMLTAGPAACEQQEASCAADHEQREGPFLMLTAGPAASMLEDEVTITVEKPTAHVAARDWHPEAKAVVAAYEDFFNHISFRKGWKDPPFTREEAIDSFQSAARVVACVRVLILDSRDTGVKIRQVEGSARDWMHSPECGSLLRDKPNQFIEGLVHATLKDANGYVEGLTEQEVGQFLAAYL